MRQISGGGDHVQRWSPPGFRRTQVKVQTHWELHYANSTITTVYTFTLLISMTLIHVFFLVFFFFAF